MAMQAIEPKTVTDFAKEFIFPKVTTNMSWNINEEATGTALGCIAESALDIIDWGELMDDLIVGTLDLFQDELNKKKCNDKHNEQTPESIRLQEDEFNRRVKKLSKKRTDNIQWLTDFLFQYIDVDLSLKIFPTDLEAAQNTR